MQSGQINNTPGGGMFYAEMAKLVVGNPGVDLVRPSFIVK
jgi:hypothetical protein